MTGVQVCVCGVHMGYMYVLWYDHIIPDKYVETLCVT